VTSLKLMTNLSSAWQSAEKECSHHPIAHFVRNGDPARRTEARTVHRYCEPRFVLNEKIQCNAENSGMRP